MGAVKYDAVIVFTRVPMAGKTKTRLMPLLSGEECCLLHKAFIRDLMTVLREACGGSDVVAGCDFDIVVYYAPDGAGWELWELMPGVCEFLPQRGENLGDRMYNAICETLGAGYGRCLLVGSDLPLLEAKTISDAFRLLDSYDIVICPTEDGGYYLIGMKEPCEEVFNIEEYGVSTVLEKTLAAAARAGKMCSIGAVTMDVDDPQDLRVLAEKLAQGASGICTETRKFLLEFCPI